MNLGELPRTKYPLVILLLNEEHASEMQNTCVVSVISQNDKLHYELLGELPQTKYLLVILLLNEEHASEMQNTCMVSVISQNDKLHKVPVNQHNCRRPSKY